MSLQSLRLSSNSTNLAPQDHCWCVDARSHSVFTPQPTSGYYFSSLRMSCPVAYRLSCKVSWLISFINIDDPARVNDMRVQVQTLQK